MFGLSRTRAAELIGDGRGPGRRPSGRQVGPGSGRRVAGRDAARIRSGAARAGRGARPGRSVYEDADILVVNKPVGVAAHPTPGWTGPTVLQGLLAAGHQIATSGAAERQGIVHRLDANTTGLMVVAKSEHAYSVLKQAFRDREVDKRYHALVQGHPDPLRGTIDAPDRAASVRRRPVRRDRRRQAVGHALRHPRGVQGREPDRGQAGDRAHAPDPGAHGRGPAPVRR